VSEVAKELSCDWHTVNDAVTTYGVRVLLHMSFRVRADMSVAGG
jgi:hypothetical protein